MQKEMRKPKETQGPIEEKSRKPVKRKAIDMTVARKDAGRRIRVMREALGVSASELAERFGISEGYLKELEEGRKQVSSTLLGFIVREYGLNNEWLLWGCGPMLSGSAAEAERPEGESRRESPAFEHFSDQRYDIETRALEGFYDIPLNHTYDEATELIELLEGMGAPVRVTRQLSDAFSNSMANTQQTAYEFGVRDTVAFFLQALEYGGKPMFTQQAAGTIARKILSSFLSDDEQKGA